MILIADTLGTEPSWNSETADEDGISLSPSSCETPNSVATDGNEVEISFTIGPTDATPYACQFCEKAFPRLSYLKKHEQVRNNFLFISLMRQKTRNYICPTDY